MNQARSHEKALQNEPKPAWQRFAPDELPGLTFLHETDDGQKVRAEVIRKINDLDAQNHKNITFLLKLGNGDADQLMSYVELCDKIEAMRQDDLEKEERGESFFFFKEIIAHQVPLSPMSMNCEGSTYNVSTRWDD